MKLPLSLVFAAIAGLTAPSWLMAAPVTSITTSPGTTFNTAAMSSAAVTGFSMAGVVVTACNLAGQCNSATWMGSDSEFGIGMATGTGWSLSLAGDSFDAPFIFATSDVGNFHFSKITIDGRGAGVAFDVISVPTASPGSDQGRQFLLDTVNIGDDYVDETFNVEYTNRLLVGGVDYRDLFTFMTIDWGVDAGGSFRFLSDTDRVAPGSSITPVEPPVGVPEPGSLALVGLALAAAGLMRRRKA